VNPSSNISEQFYVSSPEARIREGIQRPLPKALRERLRRRIRRNQHGIVQAQAQTEGQNPQLHEDHESTLARQSAKCMHEHPSRGTLWLASKGGLDDILNITNIQTYRTEEDSARTFPVDTLPWTFPRPNMPASNYYNAAERRPTARKNDNSSTTISKRRSSPALPTMASPFQWYSTLGGSAPADRI